MTMTSNYENGAVCDTVKLILNVNDFRIRSIYTSRTDHI